MNNKVEAMLKSLGIQTRKGIEYRNISEILNELSEAMQYMSKAEESYVVATLFNY